MSDAGEPSRELLRWRAIQDVEAALRLLESAGTSPARVDFQHSIAILSLELARLRRDSRDAPA
ncbi:MAG: hypothetical protein ACTHNU_14930 [Gaiellales bacterium]